MRFHLLSVWLVTAIAGRFGAGAQQEEDQQDAEEAFVEGSHLIHVQKCCPQAHMMVEVSSPTGPKFECQLQNASFSWAPDYLDERSSLHSFAETSNSTAASLCVQDTGPCILPLFGKPQCGPVRAWPIFTYAGFQEDLQLRPYGVLRHVVDKYGNLPRHYEYTLDQYCVDGVKLLSSSSHFSHAGPDLYKTDADHGPVYYGLICEPGPWDEVDFFDVFVRVFYPIGLGVGLVVLLVLVGFHFILKELRDLSGCMLISLLMSLMVSMSANMILAATDSKPSPYLNLLFLESVVHGADVAVHFWLNAIGHRAWTAVRHPRKEAMRPEGKRYLYYSLYAWGLAACAVSLALVVHFFIDQNGSGGGGKAATSPHSFFTWYKIGWLGLALFFATSCFLFLVNIYFYINSRLSISQQTAYGRTFHRNKGFFQAFSRLFFIIDAVWIFQTFSWLQYPVLVGLRVIADITLPFLILWAALKGRRVMHLLKIRLQMSQCWLCQRCFSRQSRDRGHYYGEEMMALGTPI